MDPSAFEDPSTLTEAYIKAYVFCVVPPMFAMLFSVLFRWIFAKRRNRWWKKVANNALHLAIFWFFLGQILSQLDWDKILDVLEDFNSQPWVFSNSSNRDSSWDV